MQRLVLSTQDVPDREQFGYWRELGARYFDGLAWERDGPSGAPYRGNLAAWRLDGALLLELRGEGHRSVRGQAAAARAGKDVLYVEQEIGGPARYLVGRRLIDCGPGDLVIHRPDALFDEEGPQDWATRVWVIPRQLLQPLLSGRIGATLHIPCREGMGALAAATAQAFGEQADHLDAAAAGAALDGFCRLLAIAAGVTAGEIEGGREALRAAALERIRRHVDRHLGDPELGPATVAHAAGVSERQLQRLFEASGESFARYVLRRRLEEVRAALGRPGGHPVTELALAWGFGSLTAFYRGFQRAYGAAPGEVRAALAGIAAA